MAKLVSTLECIYCTCTATTTAVRAFAKLRFISKVFAVTLPLSKVCSLKRAVGAEASSERELDRELDSAFLVLAQVRPGWCDPMETDRVSRYGFSLSLAPSDEGITVLGGQRRTHGSEAGC